jgi:hypothetical protein
MPDLIRHPVLSWIPAYAGMTAYAMDYDVLYNFFILIIRASIRSQKFAQKSQENVNF